MHFRSPRRALLDRNGHRLPFRMNANDEEFSGCRVALIPARVGMAWRLVPRVARLVNAPRFRVRLQEQSAFDNRPQTLSRVVVLPYWRARSQFNQQHHSLLTCHPGIGTRVLVLSAFRNDRMESALGSADAGTPSRLARAITRAAQRARAALNIRRGTERSPRLGRHAVGSSHSSTTATATNATAIPRG